MTYSHHVPGRIRIRSAAVKHNAARAAALREWLESIAGVTAVETSTVTGSVLVRYNPAAADGDAIVRELRDQGWTTAPHAAPPRHPSTVQRRLAKAVAGKVAEYAIERAAIALIAAIL